MITHIISIALFIAVVVLCAWFLQKGKLSGRQFVWSFVTAALAIAIIQNIDVVQKLTLKGAGGEATAEFVVGVKNDVYAKAEQVKKMTETVAGMIADSTANEGGYGGNPDKANKEIKVRRQLKDVLVATGSSQDQIDRLLQPLDDSIPSDYRSAIVGAAMDIDSRNPASSTAFNAHQLALEKALDIKPPADGLKKAKALLNGWNVSSPELTKKLTDYDHFLSNGITK